MYKAYVLTALMALGTASQGCTEVAAEALTEQPRTSQPEPRLELDPVEQLRRDVEERLAARRAAVAAEEASELKAQALAQAMERYITYVLCELPVERGGECKVNARHARALAERRDLLGFAQLLQTLVGQREREGLWVAMGHENAPAWLAAVAYHEYSWMWKSTTLRGGIGERCAFQLAGGAINRWRRGQNAQLPLVLSPEALREERMTKREAETRVSRRPWDCAEAAIEWMEHSAERCGGGDATEFLERDEDGELKRRWTRVKVPVSNPGATQWEWGNRLMVVPTEAARWMGSYATPGICGGARGIVTERFETAHHIRRFIDETAVPQERNASEEAATEATENRGPAAHTNTQRDVGQRDLPRLARRGPIRW